MLLNMLSTDVAATWDDMHRYSPAPRHRREIIVQLLSKLEFNDCLDAGCAQGYLLQKVTSQFGVQGYGCDISCKVIEDNKNRFSNCEFAVLDIEKEQWIAEKQFDVVISSEVVEHIENWRNAIKNLTSMSRRYLILTVPSGKVRHIDEKVGHYRHFEGPELVAELEKNGFTCQRVMKHGFPFHSIYKRLINWISPESIYAAYSGEKKYSFWQKFISNFLYTLFYINYLFKSGDQLIILAERNNESKNI